MIRTQISLDDREYALAKKEAEALGISVAEFVRRAIRRMLPPSGEAVWMRYAGLVESGNPLSSQSIDEIVYGFKEDADLIDQARLVARAQHKTLNAAFREWLQRYVVQSGSTQEVDSLMKRLRHVRAGRHFTRAEMSER